MKRLRRIAPEARMLLAVLLTLCLGVRLMAPPGFMPAIGNGTMTIVPCPDADGSASVAAVSTMAGMSRMGMGAGTHHHHAHKATFHEICPYAAAASLVGLDAKGAVLATIVPVAALPPVARELPAFQRRDVRERPPLRGPPVIA